MKFNMGIAGKIFSGFLILIAVGLVVGGAGYISLNRLISAGDLSALANEAQTKILDARRQEKNYVIRRDEESYKALLSRLDELGGISSRLKSLMDESTDADRIAEAKKAYLAAATELKRLEEGDAAVLAQLQQVASKVSEIAQKESDAAAWSTKEAILRSNSETLKQDALKRVKDVVAVGHDVLQHYHTQSMTREAALDAVRNLHFEGNNYYFVVKEDLTLVAHGSDRKLEGMDFGKVQDKKTGKTYMREVVENAIKNGEAYTEYFWTKPGMGDAIFPKVTYSKYFKPWGLIICGGVYVDDIEKEVARAGALIEDGLKKLQEANAINTHSLNARLNAVYYFAFQENAEKVPEHIAQLKKLAIATEALKKDADTYLEQFTQRVKNQEMRTRTIAQIQEIARSALDATSNIAQGAMGAYSSAAGNGKTIIVSFLILGGVAGLVLAFFLVRAITRPINRAIEGIQEATEQVASASEQVASAGQQLAEGASQQAASLEETSSSLEEMSSMTRQNAENATQANQLMLEANRVVDRANQSMVGLTSSMAEISRASEETQKIIRTIDEIAFQTNLLALNAAVEAARAGEAGAGFAVVADEVRNLAMRAAEAAKNTADLIEGTVKRIKEGSQLVEQTNTEFHEVTASVTKSGELVSEIAAASSEQAQGIDQINRAVSEMDKVVQQNAANAEESASASEEMNAQAAHMQGFVGDLIVLVGGAGRNGHTHHGSHRTGNVPQIMEAVSIPSLGCRRVAGGHGNGGNSAKPQLAFKRGREVPPEKLIPFAEDF